MEIGFLLAVLLLGRAAGQADGEGWLSRRGLFLAAVFCSAASAQIAAPFIANWLSLVIPAVGRGRYLGARILIQGAIQTLVQYGAGEFLTSAHETYAAYAALILAGGVFGVLAYLVLLRAPLPRQVAEAEFDLKDVAGCLHHSPYLRFLMFSLAVNVAFAFACPYYVAFFLEEVRLTPAMIARYALAYGIVRLLAIRPMGRAVDRWGARPLLKVMLSIYAIFYLAFPFLSQETYPLIVAIWAFVGIGDAIYAVAMQTMLYESVPEGRRRSSYFALERSLGLVLWAAGPFLAMAYFALMGDWAWAPGGWRIEKFRLMYVTCGVMMLFCLPLVARLPDTRDVRLRGVVRDLARRNPFGRLWRWARRREH